MQELLVGLGQLHRLLGSRTAKDLLLSGSTMLEYEDVEAAEQNKRIFRGLGLDVKTKIYSYGGHYGTCMPDKYQLYLKLPNELKAILFDEENDEF